MSEREAQAYQLYRVFHFSSHLRLYVLPGSLEASCRLEIESAARSVVARVDNRGRVCGAGGTGGSSASEPLTVFGSQFAHGHGASPK